MCRFVVGPLIVLTHIVPTLRVDYDDCGDRAFVKFLVFAFIMRKLQYVKEKGVPSSILGSIQTSFVNTSILLRM